MTTVTTASGLMIEDLAVGDGAAAKSGDHVTVHYTGWLTDGRKFDSSVDRRDPFAFALGRGNVIAGWDEGVEGMKVGGKRKLTIPPDLGYGAYGAGGVDPAQRHARVRSRTARRRLTRAPRPPAAPSAA